MGSKREQSATEMEEPPPEPSTQEEAVVAAIADSAIGGPAVGASSAPGSSVAEMALSLNTSGEG